VVRGIYRRKFRRSKKRGEGVEKTGCGKGSKRMVIADGRRGLPIAVTVHGARSGEILLARSTLESIPTRKKPKRLLGDKVYYSEPHKRQFQELFKTELIVAPKKCYRHVRRDRRKLRRLKRRWKVERLFAWLHFYRRLTTRYERYLLHYEGFMVLACVIILLRHL